MNLIHIHSADKGCCVGEGYRSYPVRESVTTLPLALFTLRLQLLYLLIQTLEVMHKLTSLVLKIFVSNLQQFRAYHDKFSW